MVLLKALLVLSVAILCDSTTCNFPSPADFEYSDYQGVWYEIGKIQTFGGAVWQKDCVCTNIEVFPSPTSEPNDAAVINCCRYEAPDGRYTNITGLLEYTGTMGHWKLSYPAIDPDNKVDYNVILIGEDYAVEYDCGQASNRDGENYCIHIMSRTPTQDTALTAELVQKSLDMGLNPRNLPFVATNHDGCWK
ncbi:uncharacterized protein [Ptychodera flava]|uniref:uncharacterized protein n=1 Tax=Ptychodera flava TaxID=63121 RepID=UPI003969E7F1